MAATGATGCDPESAGQIREFLSGALGLDLRQTADN